MKQEHAPEESLERQLCGGILEKLLFVSDVACYIVMKGLYTTRDTERKPVANQSKFSHKALLLVEFQLYGLSALHNANA